MRRNLDEAWSKAKIVDDMSYFKRHGLISFGQIESRIAMIDLNVTRVEDSAELIGQKHLNINLLEESKAAYLDNRKTFRKLWSQDKERFERLADNLTKKPSSNEAELSDFVRFRLNPDLLKAIQSYQSAAESYIASLLALY